MVMRTLALRGATTFDIDDAEHVSERTVTLVEEMMARNGLDHDDVVSVLLTATPDLRSVFPAAGVRNAGFGDVALICAQELDVEGAKERCIRVLMHINTETPRSGLHHVYLENAKDLRGDLPS